MLLKKIQRGPDFMKHGVVVVVETGFGVVEDVPAEPRNDRIGKLVEVLVCLCDLAYIVLQIPRTTVR